jgi:uncharacterized protein YdeI (YjbR/CyaY-like superfamily)
MPAKKKNPDDDLPTKSFRDAAAWEAWLVKNHTNPVGLWVRILKKATGKPSVDYQHALDVALCYGWIDGKKRTDGDEAWLQKFTPRRERSAWSNINREKARRLIADGRMQAPGLEEIERAKADGRWEAREDSPANATMHPDLEAALAKNPKAKAAFAELPTRFRLGIMYLVQTAKKPETRARRIAQYIDKLATGKSFQ